MKAKKLAEGNLTRAELAATCGVSKSTIRRWEEKGKIKPRIDERGVHRFPVEDVRALIGDRPVKRLPQARTYLPTAANASGELAAEIFSHLDKGMHPVDIVQKVPVNPDVLEGLITRYLRWRKGAVLTGVQVAAMSKAMGVELVGPGIDFIRRVQEVMKYFRRPCVGCKRGRPRYCAGCVSAREERLREKRTEGLVEETRRDERADRAHEREGG
jgi:hypothetical protein